MSRLLQGRKIAAQIRSEVAEEVKLLVEAGHRPPGLAAVLVGANPASQVYVGTKSRACDEAGLRSWVHTLPADIGSDELLSTIDRLNEDEAVDGILVQLPLPAGLVERAALERIAPHKDVDGFHSQNVGNLWLGEKAFVPATPSGVIEMLKREGIELKGKNAVIVGRSNIVGKPMAALLLAEHCTVTVCHSRTADLPAVCRGADILVVAIGRSAFIGADAVKEGAVVIDVGINRVDDAAEVEQLFPGSEKRKRRFEKNGSILVGDVDFTRVRPIAGAITPVPGGVGPLTVAMLLVNTLAAARHHLGLDPSQ
jgi:methylenetetrahydrofolate dehydrogenase (NADP+)/methenyltetrahydrofolate cyclohydrolase